MFEEKNEWKLTDVGTERSPDGRYSVVFRAVGKPKWPFGAAHVKVTVKDENRIGLLSPLGETNKPTGILRFLLIEAAYGFIRKGNFMQDKLLIWFFMGEITVKSGSFI